MRRDWWAKIARLRGGRETSAARAVGTDRNTAREREMTAAGGRWPRDRAHSLESSHSISISRAQHAVNRDFGTSKTSPPKVIDQNWQASLSCT